MIFKVRENIRNNINELWKYWDYGYTDYKYLKFSDSEINRVLSKYSFMNYDSYGSYICYKCSYHKNNLSLLINRIEDDYYYIRIYIGIISSNLWDTSIYYFKVDQMSGLLKCLGILFSNNNIGIKNYLEGYVEGGKSKIDLILSNMKLLGKYENDKDLESSDFMNISDEFYDKILRYYSFFKNNVYHLEYVINEGSKKLDITINCLEDDYYRVYIFGSFGNSHGYFGEEIYILDQFSELINFLKILFRGYEK